VTNRAATVDTLVVVRGDATLGADTVVRGDVYLADTNLTQEPSAVVQGSIRENVGAEFARGFWIVGVLLTLRASDQHRARRVPDALLADRPQQEPGESAKTTRTDHEKLRALRQADERGGRMLVAQRALLHLESGEICICLGNELSQPGRGVPSRFCPLLVVTACGLPQHRVAHPGRRRRPGGHARSDLGVGSPHRLIHVHDVEPTRTTARLVGRQPQRDRRVR
jgi:hypothetical protein